MQKKIYLFILFLSVLPSAVAQPYSFPEIRGYKIESRYPVYTAESLWDFIDGAADGYLAFGFENVHVREYRKGKKIIKVEIYRHRDKKNAFGIYASERSPLFRYLNLGSQGYKTEDGSLNFFKDKYYVKLRTYSGDQKILNDLEKLAVRIADMLPGDPSMPSLLSEFPENGKARYTEIYINRDVLGHGFLNDAFCARYEMEGASFALYFFEKDSPEKVTECVSAYLQKTGMEPDESQEGKYMLRDGYNGNIFLSWKGNRIVIIHGLEKDQSALADRYSSEILR